MLQIIPCVQMLAPRWCERYNKYHAIACLSAQTLHIFQTNKRFQLQKGSKYRFLFFSSVLSFFSSVESRGEPYFFFPVVKSFFFASVYLFGYTVQKARDQSDRSAWNIRMQW